MAGQNSIFGASGFAGTSAIPSGTAFFRALRVSHGINIDYNEEESATEHTVYLDRQIDDNFTVTILCVGQQEYNDAAMWFEVYGAFVTDPANTTISPMGVMIPSMNFSALGIPSVGISHGDMVGELTYPMTIQFVGTSDTNLAQGSTFTQAQFHGEAQYFYPSGVQNGSSTSSTDSILYDLPSPVTSVGQNNTGVVQPIGTGTP